MNCIINRLFIASDHAGFSMKKSILTSLNDSNIMDLGCNSESPVDYPDLAAILCDNISAEGNVGILICGTGIGMSIAANRYRHIRAALCHNVDYARLAREHNDANVIVLGARFLKIEEAVNIIKCFLSTEFLGGRHMERVNKLF